MNKLSEPLRAWYELKSLVTGFVPTSDQDLKFLPIFRYVGPTLVQQRISFTADYQFFRLFFNFGPTLNRIQEQYWLTITRAQSNIPGSIQFMADVGPDWLCLLGILLIRHRKQDIMIFGSIY